MQRFRIKLTALALMAAISMTGCGGGGGGGNGGAAATSPAPVADTSQTTTSNGEGPIPVLKTVTLGWDPYINPDGTPASNLAGYKVYYGTASGVYPSVITVDHDNHVNLKLEPGTYYIAVTAVDTDGNESGYSNEVSSTV